MSISFVSFTVIVKFSNTMTKNCSNCNFHLNYIGAFTASNGHLVIILQGGDYHFCKFTFLFSFYRRIILRQLY